MPRFGYHLSAPLLRKRDVALKSTRVRARGEPDPVRVRRCRLGTRAYQHVNVGTHDGGTEKKQPPPLMGRRAIAPSAVPFVVAERKTRQANRRYP